MIPRTLLALEFSTDHRSVAVVRDGVILAETQQALGRSTRVFSLVTDALAAAGVPPAEVEAVALGIGPGSYTGIRLAISVAQGWSLANGTERPLPVIPVSSFAVLAAATTGPAWLASDAQRDEWAVAEVAEGRLQGEVRLVPAAEVRTLAASQRVVGAEIVAALGVGATAYPTAGRLGQLAAGLAAQSLSAVPPESLAPVYLRTAAFVKAPVSRSIPGITDDGAT